MNNDKNLALIALDVSGWSLDAGSGTGGDASRAIAMLEAQATPLKDIEPKGLVDGSRGPKTDKLMKTLRTLGVKIAPTMSAEQVNAWVAAMVLALSDMPYSFIQYGAAEAIHVPMQFLNQVEGIIREKAKGAKLRHDLAKRRLANFERDLEKESQPKLPPPEPASNKDLLDISPALRELGLSAGWLVEVDDELQWSEKGEEHD